MTKKKKPGEDFVVHPDLAEAHRKYAEGDTASFDEAMEERAKLTKEGTPYWDTSCDWMYSRIAKKNTQKYRKGGSPPFPKKKKRKKR